MVDQMFSSKRLTFVCEYYQGPETLIDPFFQTVKVTYELSFLTYHIFIGQFSTVLHDA